jgi:hypothetical protein
MVGLVIDDEETGQVVVPELLRQASLEDGRGWWLGDVDRLVPELARSWGLRLGAPVVPGGRSAWLCDAVDRSGREVVLKVGWRHTEAEHEAEGWRRGTGTAQSGFIGPSGFSPRSRWSWSGAGRVVRCQRCPSPTSTGWSQVC